jgi:hypothetical protein
MNKGLFRCLDATKPANPREPLRNDLNFYQSIQQFAEFIESIA